MKLAQVKSILNAKVLTKNANLDMEYCSACGCDLLSDVLAFVKDHALLLTGLTNLQVVRTAEMMDISAVVFVRGKVPEKSVIGMAEEKNITLLSTDLPLYLACGMLYDNGLMKESGGK